jgi:hypothetical protein
MKLPAAARVIDMIYVVQARMNPMNTINLVLTVCSVMSPNSCEERNIIFAADFSLKQCVMAAQPYIARWAGEHPNWTTVKYRCEYPHHNDKA